MARFFISYSHVDKPMVDELVGILREIYKTHVFWYDKELTGGEEWWKKIREQIALSDVFIYVISNDSSQSEYCQNELSEACCLKKKILPVLVRAKASIPQKIEPLQIVDLSNGLRDQGGLLQLYAAIQDTLENLPPTLSHCRKEVSEIQWGHEQTNRLHLKRRTTGSG